MEPAHRLLLTAYRSSGAVVRSFPRDRHIVRVRLSQSGCGDLDHLDVALQLRDGAYTAVAHAAAEPAYHLIEHIGNRALVGNSSLDSFGHHLGGGHLTLLEVPVGRPVLHGREAPHAPDHL